MKITLKYFNNLNKQNLNARAIVSNKERTAVSVKALKEQISVLESKIAQVEQHLQDMIAPLLRENNMLDKSKSHQEFTSKIQHLVSYLGVSNRNKDAFVNMLRDTLIRKAEFFYYCHTDPTKSTYYTPTKLNNYIKIQMNSLEVIDRNSKIDKLFINS